MKQTLTLEDRLQAMKVEVGLGNHTFADAISAGDDRAVRLALLFDTYPGEYDHPDIDKWVTIEVDPVEDQSVYWLRTFAAEQEALDYFYSYPPWIPSGVINLETGYEYDVKTKCSLRARGYSNT